MFLVSKDYDFVAVGLPDSIWQNDSWKIRFLKKIYNIHS